MALLTSDLEFHSTTRGWNYEIIHRFRVTWELWS
jgi:hypothetical protein